MDSKSFDLAISRLAIRDRTEKEISDYLTDKGIEKCEVDKTLAKLKEYGYINHINFVSNYFDYGLSKKWGSKKIKNNLRNLGITEYELEDGEYNFTDLKGLDLKESFIENAWLVAVSYINNGEEIDEKLLGKIGRRLSSLGYDTDIVYKTIGKLMKQRERHESIY